MSDLAARLRAIRVFGGDLPTFDVVRIPADPVALFVEWLTEAIDAGAPEPHVAVLSTVDADGHPDARALILKDVDEHGWWFASGSTGPKGTQLAATPWAALTWYWPATGRQVRVRGQVRPGTPAENAADFLARAPGGRAEALVGHQSEPLTDQADLTRALADATARVTADPDLVAPEWTRYVLSPTEVQFFAGDPGRRHQRVAYRRVDGRWAHDQLWP
jgi:pyridoxamine 5'-phosphate oxidase